MASSGELIPSEKGFFGELVPEAEKVALHFEVSHLYVAKYPVLEKVIRLRASTSRLLFNSSSDLLMKNAIMSEKIVTSFFPALRVAAECNNIELVKTTFREARVWISEMYTAAVDLNNKFISLHKEVNSDCSLVLRMQTEGNNQAERLKKEMKVHQDCMKSLNEAKEKIKAEINHIQRELNDNKERQRLFNIEWTFANIPFFPFFSLSSAVHWPILNRFEILIERLQSQKLEKEKEFENLELKIIKEQMEYVSIQTKAGIAVSDAENLKSVEGHLFKAQLVLEKIINFWEQTEMTIKGIEQKTTASDVFLKDLKKYKVHFIKNLESVEEVWKKFSSYCLKCKSDYDRRSIDLYHFLAVNACHLSPEDLNKRITAANDKLLKLCETSRGESIGEAPSVPALPKNV